MSIKYEQRTVDLVAGVAEQLSELPHLHKEIEMIYVLSGTTAAFADNKRYDLSKGDLFIAFPNQIHYYYNENPGEFALIITKSDLLIGLKSLLNNNIPENNVLHIAENSPEFTYIKNMIHRDIKYRETVVSGYLNLLLPLVLDKLVLLPWNSKENSTLRHILNYCHEHYTEDITLDKLTENLHLSKYYISRVLNNKIGISFNSYINTLRINTACDLLANPNKKIADISEEVGFGTIRSFNRAFLNVKGITPQEYRNFKK